MATIRRKYCQETNTETGRLVKSQGLTSHVVALEIEVKEILILEVEPTGINGLLMTIEKKEITMTPSFLA